MATLPPETILSPGSGERRGSAAPDPLVAAWTALHGQAAQLALLARIAPGPQADETAIAAALDEAKPWQQALVAQGIGDVAAMLDAGLKALGTLSRRGQDTAAPALTLWREFHAAHTALLGVLGASAAA
ncbi:MAG TPA: hypothetical protein VK913_06495 [Erythrobacter sp.]|nr:hypothetical protein [Erythrobacter sp.]